MVKVFKPSYSSTPLLITEKENVFFWKEALICRNLLMKLAQSVCNLTALYMVSTF